MPDYHHSVVGWHVDPILIRRRSPATTGRRMLAVALLTLACFAAYVAAARAEEPERYQPATRSPRALVEQLAEQYFRPADISWVIRTAACETGGTFDLYAHATGFDRLLRVLYDFWGALQVDAITWATKTSELFGGHLSDPHVNFPMAAWILANVGPSAWPVCGR